MIYRNWYCLLVIIVSSLIGKSLAQGEISNNKADCLSKPNNGNTFVIAHRGVHIGIPENTIAAYKKAIELGCDFVEIDVRVTKDGKYVSIHNSTIDAYVNGTTGNVSDFTLAELKLMDIGSRIGPEWADERIPTFEEILDLCRGQIGIYLDLKVPDVKELVEIIKKHKMEKFIIWYIPSSYMEAIYELKDLCPECIPMPDPDSKDNILKMLEAIQPIVIATDMGELDEEFMKIAHENNVQVFVDEDKGNEAEWEKIIKWDTDGIQTDNPEKLIEYLIKNKK
jgi:glycerophosphoryl diester phosphodiesterase